MFRLTEPSFVPDSGIIRAEEYAVIADADAIIADAQQRAAEILNDAEQEFEAQKKQGYQDGLAEGHAELAEKMLDTITSSVDYLSSLESKVVELVNKSLRKILGDMDQNDRVAAVVRNALAVTRNESSVTLRVCPADVATVKERLDEIIKPYPGIKYVDVVPDSRLETDGCILETAIGVVDASLDIQLAAIEKSLRKSVTGEKTL